MVMRMPDGDCTGPRWKRGRGRGREYNFNENLPSTSFFRRIGGGLGSQKGNAQGMQGDRFDYDRGNGRGRGRGKGRGRGGRW